jgi:hypothetical protein
MANRPALVLRLVQTVTMPSLGEQKRQVKQGIVLLTEKEVNRTLTPAERQLLHGLRKELAVINAKLNAPKRPKAVTKGARTRQGPAGGISRVVSGGAPGSGKRA